MRANVANLDYSDKIRHYRKEDKLSRQISIIDRTTGRELVICRTYYPGTVAYCCVWIHGEPYHGSGAGKAGGGGYHKESAALSAALRDAGVVLAESIGGRGDSAMVEALEAVARAVSGKRKFFVVKAHG